MCGRYNLYPTPTELQAFFDLFREPAWTPRYNIAPTQRVLTVRFDEETGPRTPSLMRWGLLPRWAKDIKAKPQPINARAEGVAASRMFGPLLKRKRCLVPASGFYEWLRLGARSKQPYHIHHTDDRPFAFAGLWDTWSKGDQPIDSCTIITTQANDIMEPIHDRMPVILHPDDYDTWLDPLHNDPAALTKLLQPYADNDLEATPVNALVNSYRNDTAECVRPAI